jgi:hypothetical protein
MEKNFIAGESFQHLSTKREWNQRLVPSGGVISPTGMNMTKRVEDKL